MPALVDLFTQPDFLDLLAVDDPSGQPLFNRQAGGDDQRVGFFMLNDDTGDAGVRLIQMQFDGLWPVTELAQASLHAAPQVLAQPAYLQQGQLFDVTAAGRLSLRRRVRFHGHQLAHL